MSQQNTEETNATSARPIDLSWDIEVDYREDGHPILETINARFCVVAEDRFGDTDASVEILELTVGGERCQETEWEARVSWCDARSVSYEYQIVNHLNRIAASGGFGP